VLPSIVKPSGSFWMDSSSGTSMRCSVSLDVAPADIAPMSVAFRSGEGSPTAQAPIDSANTAVTTFLGIALMTLS